MKEKYLYRCIFIVLICYLIDSTLSYFLPYNYIKEGISVIPYIGLMMYSLIVKSINVPDRYFYGAICGTYYCIVYTNSLAIYILVYSLIAFVRSYIIKVESFSFSETIVYCISTVFFCEIIVYWLMIATGTTIYPIDQFIVCRILPTLLLNLFLSVFVYWFYSNIDIEVNK